jgi:hypothetical protein
VIGTRLLFGKGDGALSDRDRVGMLSDLVELLHFGVEGIDSLI